MEDQKPQTPPVQPQPNPAPQPVYPPTPTSPTVTPPSTATQPTVMTREQVEAAAKAADKGTRIKKLLVLVPLVLVLLAGGVFALSQTGLLPFSRFKTITYDNGRGAKFQLKFYTHHSVKDAPGNKNGLQELASKTSVSGLYPLVLAITDGGSNPSSRIRDCGAPYTSSETIHVQNKPTGNNVNLCAIQQQELNKTIVYIGILKSGSNYYALLFTQDVDFNKLLSNPASAKAGLAKAGLADYSDDIKTIAASVKPLP